MAEKLSLKLNKYKVCIFACCFVFVLAEAFCSGSSEKNKAKPVKVQPVPYQDASKKSRDIENIKKQMSAKPVVSLWLACLLNGTWQDDAEVNAVYLEAQNAALKAYSKAVEEKDWVSAMRLYNSLAACSISKVNELPWSVQKIENELAAAASLEGKKTQTVTKMSQFIRGTVTVWVDLGFKIEGGAGYANKVLGSGFFIDSRGYIVTNHHVIENMVNPEYEGYSRLYVTLADDPEQRIPGKVVGYDKMLDLALIKTEITPPYVFSLGSSQDLEVGDKIYAIGSPIGLDKTLTSGIISATERPLLATTNVLQIDAAINSGNSGGPLIAPDGTVQGIVFAGMLDYEGLNFAIPVEFLRKILPRLYAGGKISHCWIGAYGKTKKDDYYQDVGLEVLYLMPGSPAARAGVKAGEIIVALDGKRIKTLDEYQNELLNKIPDSLIAIDCVDKNGNLVRHVVYTQPRPEMPSNEVYQRDTIENYFLPLFGMQLRTAGETLNKKNYYVERVIPNSTAEENGFSSSDKIQITKFKVFKEENYAMAEIYAKRRKSGYIDIFIGVATALDSPSYF
ncbi:MAG: serine protease [Spirochaetaceae bacterium]|nr:serine protease [Spirochaetaceae bacterium]